MIRAMLVGQDRVIAHLGQVHPRVQAALAKTIGRLVLDLTRYVKGGKLSGQVLRNRTGRLRRSVNPQVQVTEAGVEGRVGTNVVYGRVHEYGFQGPVMVRAHLRRLKAVKKAALGSGKASGVAFVRSHTRRVNLPERSFLRSALQDMAATIKQEIAQAVHGVTGRW